MLKYFLMMIFMIPFSFKKWVYLQLSFFLIGMLFMFELGTFNHSESMLSSYGIDMMSYMLILLSFWICLFMLMSMKLKFFNNYFKFILIMLMVFLLMSFYSMNLFLFYLYFESSLIPTFLIILGWGYQSERIQAGVYLLMYTLVFSLPLLIMIMFMYNSWFSMSMLINIEKCIGFNFIIFLSLYMAFLVKLPLFLIHLWLPKAHVEAPVAGSMILAGILLKLGGYGILRLSNLIFNLVFKYIYMMIILSLVGGVFISLNCLRQSDIKLLIAYSSVSHMGLMLAGLLSFSCWGIYSSFCMMLSHGLCSSGLFFLANVCYERVGSRSLYLVKGMLHFLPKMSLWWFLFCAMNMACPPSMNLLSEVGLIISIVGWSWFNSILIMLIGIFVAGYSLYLFSFSQHGKFNSMIYSFMQSNVREFFILFMHWWPLNLFILSGELFMIWI
uniref:NADH-ubiquinone oxidoreductase chain 4 n=1 Tax=Fuelleborniella sp. FuspCA TaxID=2597024 RepID=A0A8K1ZFG4_9NEOP|nr:NADH dehydrogenase subunit 4 [Fuelleborniella sp. FuspCA]